MSPYRTDARYSGRHPFQLYSLFLSVITGLPVVLGAAPRPGSVTAALDGWLGDAWCWTLVLGALTALFGVYWHDRGTGMVLEQLGLGLVGLASIIYVTCVIVVVGAPGFITSGIVAAFGISCLVRYWQIQRDLDRVVAEVERGRLCE